MEKDSILAFDTLFSFSQTQMLKIALPYLPNEYQHIFAIYIKFMELKHTIAMSDQTANLTFCTDSENQKDNPYQKITSFIENITPYISNDEQGKIDRIKNLIQSLKQFQDMKPMIDMIMNMQNAETGSNTENILKNFLNDDQIDMFQFFMNQNEGD